MHEQMSLYRTEVLVAQSDRLEGEILIARSFASWGVFWIVVVIILLTLVFLCTATYAKRASAEGILVLGGGAIPIISPAAGRIKEVRVVEGQVVKQGDVLFVISSERFLNDNTLLKKGEAFTERMREALTEQMTSLETEREQVKHIFERDELDRKKQQESMQQDLELVDIQIKLNGERMRLAENRLRDYTELNKTLVVSNQTVQEQADGLSALNIQLITYKRQRTEIQRAIQKVISEALQAPELTAIKINNIEREISLRKQKVAEQLAQGEWLVVAPIGGKVTAITGANGQAPTNQSLAVILPQDAKLNAQLFVPSSEVGFIEVGQEVKLRYQAFPYQKFGQYIGYVSEAAKSPIDNNSMPYIFNATSAESKYRVTVEIDSQTIMYKGKTKELVSGMMLAADIKQEERLLIEWLLEPLYTLRRLE